MKSFVCVDGKNYGPYSLEKLREHVRAGNFRVNNLASHDGKNWIKIHELPGFKLQTPEPPSKVEAGDFLRRGLFLGEIADARVKIFAISSAFLGFIAHLCIWALYSSGKIEVKGETVNLLISPFSALYTPFSILLAYEAYQLIREIPTSFSNSVGKQFEIVTLLVVRDIFKNLSLLEFNNEWVLDDRLKLLSLECITFVVLFYTSLNYRKCSISLMVSTMNVNNLKIYIKSKRIIAQILLFTYVIIAVLAFTGWVQGVMLGHGDADRKIFFLDFFTCLIMADILILLMFYRYSEDFNALARNTGFILATVILRVAIGAPGISSMFLFTLSGILGIAILRITLHFYSPPSGKNFNNKDLQGISD